MDTCARPSGCVTRRVCGRDVLITRALFLSHTVAFAFARFLSFSLSHTLSRSLAPSLFRSLSHTLPRSLARANSAHSLSPSHAHTHTLSCVRARALSLSIARSLSCNSLTPSLTHTHISLSILRALSLSVSRLLVRFNTALPLPLSLTWLVAIGEGPRRDPGRTFKKSSCTRPCYF